MRSTSPAASKSYDDYQTESDVRTLAEAEKIKGDKKRHGKAKKRAREMANDLARVHQTPSMGKQPKQPVNDGDADDQ